VFGFLGEEGRDCSFLNGCSDCWVSVARRRSCQNLSSDCCVIVDRRCSRLNEVSNCWIKIGRGCSFLNAMFKLLGRGRQGL